MVEALPAPRYHAVAAVWRAGKCSETKKSVNPSPLVFLDRILIFSVQPVPDLSVRSFFSSRPVEVTVEGQPQ